MNFLTWEKENIASRQTLRFYLEGNGDPNPQKPMALLLAQKDKTKNIVVLTRPCQYLNNKVCNNKEIWGKERYNPEILNDIIHEFRLNRNCDIKYIGSEGGVESNHYRCHNCKNKEEN
jgi:hypothetical protein